MANESSLYDDLQQRLDLAASFREDVRLLASDVGQHLAESDALQPPLYPAGPRQMVAIDQMSAHYIVPFVKVTAGSIALQLETYETMPAKNSLEVLQERLARARSPRQATRAADLIDNSLRRHDQANAADLHTLLQISRLAVRADLPLPRYDRLKTFQQLTGANAYQDFWSGQRITY